MQPFQERVIEESKELNDRLQKLELFIGGAIFTMVPIKERVRLINQSHAMSLYSNILKERILNFE